MEASKNVHRAIRVSNFLFAEIRIGRINHMFRLAPGDHGNLIIQSLRTPEISLREVWKNLVLNNFLVQCDDNPVHAPGLALRIRGRNRHG